MAVSSNTTDIKLQIQIETGETKNGKAVLKNLNFSKIKASATNEELFAAGSAIAGLQTKTLADINAVSTHVLTENI